MLNNFSATAASRAVAISCAHYFTRYLVLALDSYDIALTVLKAFLLSLYAVIAMTLTDSIDVLSQCLLDWSKRQLIRILTQASKAIDKAILSLSTPELTEEACVHTMPSTSPSEAPTSFTNSNVSDKGSELSEGTGIIFSIGFEGSTQRHPSPRLFLLLALANDVQEFLAGFSVRDLKAICRDARLEGYSRHKSKTKLVRFLVTQLTQ